MLLLRTVVPFGLIAIFANCELTDVVNTTFGPIRGEIVTTVLYSVKYAAFRGIKYAKAPVGYQRFKPPIPVDPWTEVLNATTEGPCCSQFSGRKIIGSEDCLYLNVYTPVTKLENNRKRLKSVMVWIYGGAWATGTSASEMYGPDYMIERDVVLITFNYRAGAFGFLSLDHPNATGNVGLKDQKLVLKWIQANIRNFGGNPKNVTLIGGSAGAATVGYHVISDASVGLFHGAISMSGTTLMPWGFQTVATNLAYASKLARLLGTNSTDKTILLTAFYKASAVDIVNATALIDRIIAFLPTLEDPSIATDVFFSKCSMSKYYSGNFTKIPQIIGYMEEETVTFTYCRKEEYGPYLQTIVEIMELVNYFGMDMPECLPLALDTFDLWGSESLGIFETRLIGETVKEMSDFLYISPTDLTQKILAAYNEDKPVYYYHISFDMPKSAHNLIRNCSIPGAGHGDDLAYMFYSPRMKYTPDPETPLGKTIYRVTTMWTNFAKYGNPTPHWVHEYPLNITWPDSGPKGLALEIGNELKVGPRPMNEHQKLIESYYWPRLPQIQGC